jgi:probable F420-dependent oxidoreductase
MKPFRFGVQSFSAETPKAWRDRARQAEALGYSALHLADHYIGPGPALAATGHPLQGLAAVPAMAVAAEATSTLRIGCRVFCIDYRPLAVLAKEAATLDFFSEGRLELGLGAGWLEGEYDAIGLTMDPASQRITRLAESVAAIKALFSGEEVDIDGDHVHLHGFTQVPATVQRPHPPIIIGGGAKRVLTLAGQQGDIVSFNFNNASGTIGAAGILSGTATGTADKVGWVRDAAASSGRALSDIELEIGAYFTFVTNAAQQTAEGFGKMFGLSTEEMLQHPHALFGTTAEIADELIRRRDLYGISYITINDTAIEAFAPVVEQLAGT